MERYYFDHNATTPVRPEVLDAMMPYLTGMYGNPSSAHHFGREARDAVERSRASVAALIHADPDEVYFTGCGTESDNIALAGAVYAAGGGKGVVTTEVEHSAVLRTARKLGDDGFPARFVGVDTSCVVDLDELADTLGDDIAVVSVMHGNNETGVVQPLTEAARIAHDAGALFHTDAVQSAGKVPVDVRAMDVDLLSMSGHKLNAPKGTGVLYIRRGVTVSPLTYGGSHEKGMRPGTENVAGIVAIGVAAELAMKDMAAGHGELVALRDRLEAGIEASIDEVVFNGRDVERLPGTANMSFPGVDGEALLFSLDRKGIAVSTGSACNTGEVEPSHVLVAMGISPKLAQGSLRFSLGWGSDGEGVDHALEVLPPVVKRLRAVSGGV